MSRFLIRKMSDFYHYNNAACPPSTTVSDFIFIIFGFLSMLTEIDIGSDVRFVKL